MLALDNSLVLLLNIVNEVITDGDAPRHRYLEWAAQLMGDRYVRNLVQVVEADRTAIGVNTVLFRPPLDRLEGELTLPAFNRDFEIEEEEKVTLVAEFELSRLNSLAINSLKGYLIGFNFVSDEWPIRYANGHSRKQDQLLKNVDLRPLVERTTMRTSLALSAHINHRLPIGHLPEEALDFEITEGDLQLKTINALSAGGITNYGDLGILSINQLMKIHHIGEGAVEDIKVELARLGWLSPVFKSVL